MKSKEKELPKRRNFVAAHAGINKAARHRIATKYDRKRLKRENFED